MEITINKYDYLNSITESINASCNVNYHLFITNSVVEKDCFVINMEHSDIETVPITICFGSYEKCKSFLLKWKDMVY